MFYDCVAWFLVFVCDLVFDCVCLELLIKIIKKIMQKPSSIYWASLITWDFWKWKTFWIWCDVYKQKQEYKDICLIANLPRSITDHFYSSMSDFLKIIDYLFTFVEETNNQETLTNYESKYKDIIFVCDEAHRYLWARDFANKELWSKFWILLTQCRKRNIRIVAITQRLTMIDIRFRRLSDYVEEYKRGSFLWLYRVRHSVYENRWDLADIEVDNTVRVADDWTAKTLKDDSKLYSEFFTPLTIWLQMFALCSSPYRRILKEYYNTYYICALYDKNSDHFTLDEFDKALYVPDYVAKLENVIDVKENSSKKLSLVETSSKVIQGYNKIRSKIIDVLDTTDKGSNVKSNLYPCKNDFKNTLEDLKNDEIILSSDKESSKKVSVADLLNNVN